MHRSILALSLVSLATALMAVPHEAAAQRRPGVGTGFYTYTGLVSTDVEAGSVSSTTAFAEAPTVAASVLVTAPLRKLKRKAIIVGVRATPLAFGNTGGCLIIPPVLSCQNRRFLERASVLPGAAFDIRETLLRVMVGPALYSVEDAGTRLGTQVRLDYTNPRQGARMPTIFLTRTFLGSQNGRGVGMTTLGVGIRFARKK